MSKSVWFVVFIAIVTNLHGQRNFRGIPLEVNVIPNDSNYTLYISYTISYDRLVFVKKNGYYEGGLELTVEAAAGEDIVNRESTESIVRIGDYDLTNSKKDYLQGLLTMQLDSGRYDFYPQFSVLNTKRSLNLPSVNYDISSTDSSGMKPLVLNMYSSDCLGEKNYILTNFGGAIPFSPTGSRLLIPVGENTDEIEVVIKSFEDEILMQRKLSDYEIFIPALKLCNNQVLVTRESGKNIRIFMLDDFSKKFEEGKIKIIVKAKDKEYNHDLSVSWIDRPLSLSSSALSVNILSGIFSSEELSEVKGSSENDYYENLFSFWSKYDRDTTTAFNEVMNEFYLRVDHAIVEYRSVSEANGATTDRGKIYIKYGEPDDIERKYTDQGEILEIWKYKKLNREFVFSDVSGLGNYSLIN